MTRYGVFLRAALPRTLTDRDIAFLRDYGLTTVVDFRSELECVRAPDPLGALDGITYLNKPMFDAAAAGGALRIQPEAAFGWVPHYIRMLEQQKSWMADVLRALAQAEGCALFHCTTGKDRAGLISALLLKLAGASMRTWWRTIASARSISGRCTPRWSRPPASAAAISTAAFTARSRGHARRAGISDGELRRRGGLSPVLRPDRCGAGYAAGKNNLHSRGCWSIITEPVSFYDQKSKGSQRA
jgi:hypothetical protein